MRRTNKGVLPIHNLFRVRKRTTQTLSCQLEDFRPEPARRKRLSTATRLTPRESALPQVVQLTHGEKAVEFPQRGVQYRASTPPPPNKREHFHLFD